MVITKIKKIFDKRDPSKDVLPKTNGKLNRHVKNFNGRGQLITTNYKNGLINRLHTHYYEKSKCKIKNSNV